MDQVDRLVAAARRSVVQLMASVRTQAARGVDVEHLQASYVGEALRMLEDVETYAVIASTGDVEARAAIEQLVEEIERLRTALDEDVD